MGEWWHAILGQARALTVINQKRRFAVRLAARGEPGV